MEPSTGHPDWSTRRRNALRAALFTCAVVTLWATAFGTRHVHAQPRADVDIDVFYDELSPYGRWARSVDYGEVWYPDDVPPNWRPYADGRWVWTDDYGWYWEADEPWGWATFHYGRWFHHPRNGWGWVPGTVWGPAWVAWRWGEGYMGWAPLPPSVRIEFGGPELVDRDYDVSIAPSDWVFVEERSFNAPRVYDVAVAPSRNAWIVHRTRPATRYGVHRDRIINRGIPLTRVETVTRAPFRRSHVHVDVRSNPRVFRNYEVERVRTRRYEAPPARSYVRRERRDAPAARPVLRHEERHDAPAAHPFREERGAKIERPYRHEDRDDPRSRHGRDDDRRGREDRGGDDRRRDDHRRGDDRRGDDRRRDDRRHDDHRRGDDRRHDDNRREAPSAHH